MLLGVSDDRAHRWRRRRAECATLEDRPPGGVALHALRPAETAAILGLVEEWGPTDRSSRKLAHRGSYLARVWVSPSTVRRVLAAHGLVLPEAPARDPGAAARLAGLVGLGAQQDLVLGRDPFRCRRAGGVRDRRRS